MKLKEFLKVAGDANITVNHKDIFYREVSDIALLKDIEVVYITPINGKIFCLKWGEIE
ncbi:hypothetical protein NNG48_06940 [Enterococcus faecium]|nr:hypothetical protein [Enterococcus faecium]